MITHLHDWFFGILLALLGIYLFTISRKKCWSTFCEIKKHHTGKTINKDIVSAMLGFLLVAIGILRVLM
jgi:hypothetical protein